MKSKAPLALMEQMVMLLVFALAAALCLQAFVTSDELSKNSEDRDRAAILCQNAAEAVRGAGGNLEEAAERLGIAYGAYAQGEPAFSAHYNADWTLSNTPDYTYRLSVQPVDSRVDGLGKASVSVMKEDGSTLFELDIAWQEEVAVGG